MQELAVFLIVLLAAAYATWKLMPRALRVRFAQSVVARARRDGRMSDREAAALARKLTASGCGSCDTCGTCGPEPAAAPAVKRDAVLLRFPPPSP